MKKVVLWGLKAVGILLLLLPFGFGSFKGQIAGLSLADWALVGGVGLLVVSMVLYRIFVGPPVFTEEEEKEWEKREKEWREMHERWFNDPGNPASPLYPRFQWEDPWEK